MLNREEVHRAVDLHRRSYNLLRWLTTAVSKGVIRFDRAHDYLDEGEAAKEWIERHYLNLPPDCRPETEDLQPFAKFFATYLTTSFDLVKQPKQRLYSECGCGCPMCSYLVAAPHLQPKKVYRRDKARARKMKIDALRELAFKCDTRLDQQQAEALIDSPDSAMDASLIAYGQQLVARTRGTSEGPAVLALWREIAWDTTAPKKNFQLDAKNILRAQESLAKRVSDSPINNSH
jgi:hypothetical protein